MYHFFLLFLLLSFSDTVFSMDQQHSADDSLELSQEELAQIHDYVQRTVSAEMLAWQNQRGESTHLIDHQGFGKLELSRPKGLLATLLSYVR